MPYRSFCRGRAEDCLGPPSVILRELWDWPAAGTRRDVLDPCGYAKQE